jgi:phosphoserine phosphatase
LIELLSDLPQNRRDENLRNSRQLLDTFKAWFDKTYKGSYEGFIRESDRLFAGMLRGLRANEVFKKCQKWCKEDASHHLYSYARPLIRMVKHIGVVPTLITGTPAEAVAGFRQELEIEDRCHPLELSTNPETGRYMELKYETGLAKSKNEVIRKIIKSGNRIVLSAGDQKTDSPLHEASLFREQDSFSGLACYLGTNREDIQGFSQHVERRWMLHIDHTELTTFSILEMIVERLDAIAQLKENQSVMTVGFREKVQNLIQDRESIRQFIVSEKDEG